MFSVFSSHFCNVDRPARYVNKSAPRSDFGMAMVNMIGNNDLTGDYILPITNGSADSPWLTAVAPCVLFCTSCVPIFVSFSDRFTRLCAAFCFPCLLSTHLSRLFGYDADAAGLVSPRWLCYNICCRHFFSSLQQDQSETFKRGGYFHQEVLPNIHVLSLNTVIYSPLHRPANVTLTDPFAQFEWLEATLARLSVQRHRGRRRLGGAANNFAV